MNEKEIMQEIWKEALGLEKCPETDESFFELGGNSFIANKICLVFEDKTGRTIEIADFFENDTIDALIS